jgi:hypothetical protein
MQVLFHFPALIKFGLQKQPSTQTGGHVYEGSSKQFASQMGSGPHF